MPGVDPIEALIAIKENLRKQQQAKAQKAQTSPQTKLSQDKQQSAMEFELQHLIKLMQEEEENQADFSSMIDNVQVMKQDTVHLQSKGISAEQAKARQRAAQHEKYQEKYSFSMEKIHYLNPSDVTGYKKEGIQRGVYLKVKNGEYTIRDYLDLHNKTLDQARVAVDEFIAKSHEKGYRFVIIIHGKGEFTKPKAFLKSFVFHWLKQAAPVLAFHHAMPYHGGPGATYVLIKKNEQEKPEFR